MSAVLKTLSGLGLAHGLITLLEGVLIICLIVQFLLSLVLRGQENRFTRFFANVTGPVLAPLERIIPRITLGGVQFSVAFIFAWWAIVAVALLLRQALPAGW